MSKKMSGERMTRKVVVKKVSDEPVAEGEEERVMESLEMDFDIPVEHNEILESMTELLNKGDKRYLTHEELRDFEMLMERKGVVDKGGLLKKGGILDKAGLMKDGELIKVDPEENKKLSLAEHLWPAINKANEEKTARKREMEAIRSGVREGGREGGSSFRRVSSSVNRRRVVKEIRAKQARDESRDESDGAVQLETTKKKKDKTLQQDEPRKREKKSKRAVSSEKPAVVTTVSQAVRTTKKQETRTGKTDISSFEEEEEDEHPEEETATNFRYLLYITEGIKERPGPDGPGPPVISYQVSLQCLSRGSKESKKVHFWEVPKTVFPIKDRIQRQLNIPIAFQHDLSFAGQPLEDSTLISTIGIKPGGELQLSYLSKGELEEVRIVYEWLKFMKKYGKLSHPSIFTGMCRDFHNIAIQGINECLLEKLAGELFVPWESDVKYANRTYFIQMDGVGVLIDFYETLIQESWRTMVMQMKLVEAGCILVLATLGLSTLNQQKIMAADGHGFVLQSLLRPQIRRHTPLLDTSGAPGSLSHSNFLLKEIVDAAIKFFFNYKECSEVHIDLCSKSTAVDQVLGIAHSPSFSIEQAQDILTIMVCCMHSPDTHKWLCRNPTIEGIMDCVKTHRERGLASKDDLLLLHYYSQVILTHLIISSCDFMSRKVMDKLVLFMSDFLRDSNPIAIQKLEKKCRPGKSSWSTFLPYLKVLMSPMKLNMESRRHVVGKDSAIFTKLQELGLQMTLFVIQAMASEDPHRARRQLLEEKIFTYALCLTSNVPRNLLSEARKFVTTLRSDSTKAVPIPKLNVMARAKLGSIHFGLKRVMDRSAEELKLEVSPPPPRSVGRRNPSATDSNFNPLFCIISM